jgi:hypothetical protein
VLYTPRAGFVGSDTFTYTVTDGRGGSAQATVTVTVTQPNRSPVAANDTAAVAAESRDNAINVLANDTDPDGDTLTISAVGTPANGAATISGTRVLYTPRADFVGSDSFSYTVSDGRGGSAQATVSVTVSRPNRAPVAVEDTAFTPARDPVNVTVLANDSDPDGDVIRVITVTQPNRGAVTINADGTVRFTPFSDWCGLSVFTYTISDTGGLTATARVIVQRTPGTLGSAADDLAAIQACDDGTP